MTLTKFLSLAVTNYFATRKPFSDWFKILKNSTLNAYSKLKKVKLFDFLLQDKESFKLPHNPQDCQLSPGRVT